MARGELYLGTNTGNLQLLVAFSRTFDIKDILLSREARTASARLVRDVIATKKEFNLGYDLIDGTDLAVYTGLYALNTELLFRVYTDATNFDDYTVLMSPITKRRVLMSGDGLWTNVRIRLREV